MRIKLEPRDCWVGLYWKRLDRWCVRFYLCIIPCLPIVWTAEIYDRYWDEQGDE